MSEQGYNGYSNYETCLTMMWLDNNQDLYKQVRALARRLSYDKYELEKELKEFVESRNPLREAEASLFTDLLSTALTKVDYQDIVDNLMSEIEED